MALSFNPPLTQQTRLPVPADGNVHLRLTATFASREAYEHARDQNTFVEIWTDLPAGSNADGWHALRFEYPEDKASKAQDKGAKIVSLIPRAQSSAPGLDGANRSVFLDVSLKDVLPGSTYSFTYRLVRSSGAIEWLGAHGRDGKLVFEKDDDRLAWADGWEFRHSKAVVESSKGANEVVAVMNTEMEWTCWSFGEHGWPTLSANKATPLSKVLLLIPRRVPSSTSIVVPQPLLLTVSDPSSTLSTDENGRILAGGATVITVQTLDMQNAVAALKSALPETSQVLRFGLDAGCIVLATPSSRDVTFPVAVSFIPLAVLDDDGQYDVRIRKEDLQDMTPAVETSDAVLIGASTTTFCFVGPQMVEDVIIRVGIAGGQLLLSPLHALASTESSPWKFAMLSPTASALVESLESLESCDGVPSALPTPPPSPPPTITSMRTGPQSTTPEGISIPSFQSFQSLAESFDSEDTVVPLSPTSVASEDAVKVREGRTSEPEAAEVDEGGDHEEREETPVPLTVAPPQRRPVLHDGLLPFFFTWLIRALLARVWGLVDTGARWVGLRSIYDSGSLARGGVVHQLDRQGQTNRTAISWDSIPAERAHAPSSATVHEVVDNSTNAPALPDEEADESVPHEPQEPVERITPLPFNSPVLASPGVRRNRPRFLADVRSNIVSFLVRAPHMHAKPSDLSISINEKRVENGQGYSCSQLSGDVYLLGLQGPEGGSKVEVALD